MAVFELERNARYQVGAVGNPYHHRKCWLLRLEYTLIKAMKNRRKSLRLDSMLAVRDAKRNQIMLPLRTVEHFKS